MDTEIRCFWNRRQAALQSGGGQGALIEAWRRHYNTVRPHSSLGYPGAFSEFVVTSARRLYAVPDGMSFTQAAAFPVALQTMHDAIATNGRLEPGQSVMIQGASTGVGLIGMQIAKVLGAGLVIGSSTTAERRARLTDFGADLAVDSRAGDWVAAVHEATGGGVDLLVDQISGSAMNDNLLATRIGGRIVNVGRLGGERAEFNFDLHALRRISYVGVTFRTRTMAEIDAVVAQTQRALGPALARGDIRMPIDRIFAFTNAAAALEYMGRNAHFGKVALTME